MHALVTLVQTKGKWKKMQDVGIFSAMRPELSTRNARRDDVSRATRSPKECVTSHEHQAAARGYRSTLTEVTVLHGQEKRTAARKETRGEGTVVERENITSPRQRRRRPCRSSPCPCRSSPFPGTEAEWVSGRRARGRGRDAAISTRERINRS